MRPGRIDKKVQYKLATQAQAEALFLRFYPESVLELDLTRAMKTDDSASTSEKQEIHDIKNLLRSLASQFSAAIPPHEFSTAELQGYLLGCKTSPRQSVAGIVAWVESEMSERQEKTRKEEGKKLERAKAVTEKEAEMASRVGPGMIPGFRMGVSSMNPSPLGSVLPLTPVTPGFPIESTPVPTVVGVPGVDTLAEQAEDTQIPPAVVHTQKPHMNGTA